MLFGETTPSAPTFTVVPETSCVPDPQTTSNTGTTNNDPPGGNNGNNGNNGGTGGSNVGTGGFDGSDFTLTGGIENFGTVVTNNDPSGGSPGDPPATVPEPGSLPLFATFLAAAGAVLMWRRRHIS